VQAEPASLEELGRLGVPAVPALVVGDQAVHGWAPAGYARLLGIAYTATSALAPAELARRLDRVLAAAEGLIRVWPAPALDFTPPERARTVRDLAYHIFRLALAFADAMKAGELPEHWLGEAAPPGMSDGLALASYGGLVRRRLQGWFESAAAAEYTRVIRVFYGPQAGHELLERTTWHAAQHLRQLYDLAGRLGFTPPAPLPADALSGLPLPEAIW
jgi:DinB superfamily